MTVSRVINRKGYVSEATRRKVERAVQTLNYRPNLLARSLRTNRTGAVGIVLADAGDASSQLAQGIQEVLNQNGYVAFICPGEESAGLQRSSLQAFYHHFDGLIVAARFSFPGMESLTSMAGEDFPIVRIGSLQANHPLVYAVAADERKGGYDATEHLLSLGHRDIAFLGASLLDDFRLQCFQGYLDAIKRHNLPLREERVVGLGSSSAPGYSAELAGYQATVRLLHQAQPPTGVFARDDRTALGAIWAARSRGFRVPEDLAVVGFYDSPIASMSRPTLTTVYTPVVDQGRHAAEIVLRRLQRQPGDNLPRQVVMKCRLVARESTAARSRS